MFTNLDLFGIFWDSAWRFNLSESEVHEPEIPGRVGLVLVALEEDDEPALDTFWVDQDELLSNIAVDDIEEALETRHEAVVAGLRPKKRARK